MEVDVSVEHTGAAGAGTQRVVDDNQDKFEI